MCFGVTGHPSDFPAIVELHNQQDERNHEIGCCDTDEHSHHFTSLSASAGMVAVRMGRWDA